MQKSHHPTVLIVVLGILNALTPFTIDLYLPAFPQIAADLDVAVSRMSLSVSVYFIGFALGQIIYGPLLDRFGRQLRYVLVRNQVRGNDFHVLEQSGEQARAQSLSAKVVSIKKLHDGVIQKVDSGSSTFGDAKGAEKDAGGLGLMDRQRLKMWLRDAYRELDEVGI